MARSRVHMTVGNDRLYFPLTPNSVSEKDGTTSVSFQIIKDGEHKIPRGTSVTGYSWNGTLPNEAMASLGFVDGDNWLAPKNIIKKLKDWQKKKKIIKLVVTGVGISDDVFIETMNFTHQGAGLVNYQMNVSKYRPLSVTTAPPQPKVKIPEEKPSKTTTQPQGQGTHNPPKTTPTSDGTKTQLSVTIPTSGLVKPKTNPVIVTTKPTSLGQQGLGWNIINLLK